MGVGVGGESGVTRARALLTCLASPGCCGVPGQNKTRPCLIPPDLHQPRQAVMEGTGGGGLTVFYGELNTSIGPRAAGQQGAPGLQK